MVFVGARFLILWWTARCFSFAHQIVRVYFNRIDAWWFRMTRHIQTGNAAWRMVLLPMALAFVLSLLAQPARAQEEQEQRPGRGPSIASVESTYYGWTELLNPHPGTFEGDLKVRAITSSVQAGFPLVFQGGKILLFNGAFFDQLHLGYQNWDASVTPKDEQPSSFYALGWQMTLINALTKRSRLLTQLRWGLFSDLIEVDENDARLYGLVMVDRDLIQGMVLGLGIAYHSDFGYPHPMPFLHFAYQNSWFRTDMGLPSNVELFFAPHERIELGARGRLSGNEYKMTYQDEALDNILIQVSTMDVGPAVNLRLVAGLWLRFFGGYAFNNRYKTVAPNGKEIRDVSLDNTWFVNANLSYNLF